MRTTPTSTETFMQTLGREKRPDSENKYLDGSMLPIQSIFYTIKDSGPFAGYPAVFVDIGEHGCVIDDLMSVRAITSSVLECLAERNVIVKQSALVVIDGDEPFKQNIAPLVRTLASAGYRVQIETGGELYVDDLPLSTVTIVCSPKSETIHPRLLPHIDAFKYQIQASNVAADGLPYGLARPPANSTKHVYVIPVRNSQFAANIDMCVDSCKRFGYILQGY